MHCQVFKRKIYKKEGNISFVSYLDATGETIETLPPSSISPPVAGKIFRSKVPFNTRHCKGKVTDYKMINISQYIT